MTHHDGFPPPQPTGPGLTATTKVLLAGLAVLAVLAVVAIIAVIITDPGGDEASLAESSAVNQTAAPGAATEEQHTDGDQPGDAPTPPVAGAFPGAGGARPDGAEPLPTYISRYGGLESAHLLTPTGNIGCDFHTADTEGRQGLCGIRSFNTPSSPLGCVQRHRDCRGKWIVPFENDRVAEPTDSSSTTGWMNQPANDGYQVPQVEYGKQYYFRDWVVASEFNGLTVWNTSTGSGAFLSRERVERFDGAGGGDPAPDNVAGEAIVLGSAASNSRGFGTAQPGEIHSGGSGSSTYAYDLTWRDWGSDRATATGLGSSPVDGEPVTVVAFEPGQCGGQRAYTKVAYFSPGQGETFESASTLDVCWDR